MVDDMLCTRAERMHLPQRAAPRDDHAAAVLNTQALTAAADAAVAAAAAIAAGGSPQLLGTAGAAAGSISRQWQHLQPDPGHIMDPSRIGAQRMPHHAGACSAVCCCVGFVLLPFVFAPHQCCLVPTHAPRLPIPGCCSVSHLCGT
jgi:hypothetical protein